MAKNIIIVVLAVMMTGLIWVGLFDSPQSHSILTDFQKKFSKINAPHLGAIQPKEVQIPSPTWEPRTNHLDTARYPKETEPSLPKPTQTGPQRLSIKLFSQKESQSNRRPERFPKDFGLPSNLKPQAVPNQLNALQKDMPDSQPKPIQQDPGKDFLSREEMNKVMKILEEARLYLKKSTFQFKNQRTVAVPQKKSEISLERGADLLKKKLSVGQDTSESIRSSHWRWPAWNQTLIRKQSQIKGPAG